ncbi:alanine racemase [Cryobacterium sp. BB736]|uniref:alanine racemase n=1 Tax=Cryobacterium sp. BB736 TaxID=2746963 RepID=UPI00187365BD|nr:alanine racemase [Cryobacterium sp. BB736]
MTPVEAIAQVSTGAIRHNVQVMRDRVAPAELLAIVKDNAYGHGLEQVLEVLVGEGVRRFGTLDLDGAFRVRSLVPDAMVFAWVFDSHSELGAAVRAGIDLGVTDAATLERVAQAAGDLTARIHLKVDSGLHRAGVLPDRWSEFTERAAELQRAGRVSVYGLWTHLAEASDEDDSRSIAEYESAVQLAREHGLDSATRHVAASAAAYARADARFDLVRIGAFLYGIAPGGGVGPGQLGLRPAMTVRDRVSAVRVDAGRTLAEIGYGGVLGLLSDAAGAVSVAIGGVRHPITAVEPLRTIIDVTGSEVSVGDQVTLFGDGSAGEATTQEWADAMGTIGEELVLRVSSRVPRHYVD